LLQLDRFLVFIDEDEDRGLQGFKFRFLGLVGLVILFAVVTHAAASGSDIAQGSTDPTVQSTSSHTPGIYLYAGESIIRSADGLRRVAVGDPNVADVKVLEEDTFLINGVGTGYTTLMIWHHQGIDKINLVVTARPPLDLGYVERLVKTWDVKPSWWKEYLVLQGTVGSEADKEVVENLVRSLWDPVISLVTVEKAVEQLQDIPEEPIEHCPSQEIEFVLGMPEISIQVVKDLAILQGQVKSPADRLRADGIARQFVPEVLNLIQVVTLPQEVELDVEPIDENEATVLDSDLESPTIIEDIKTLCEVWGYTLRPFGEIILLEGEVYDVAQRAAIVSLLEAYGFIYVDATTEKTPTIGVDDLADLSVILQQLPGLRDVGVSQKGNRLIIEGYGQDLAIIELAEILAGDYGTPLGLEVFNLIRIPTRERKKPSASLIQAEMGIPGLVVRWVGDSLVLEGFLEPRLHMAAVALAAQYSSEVVDLISNQSLSALTITEIEALIATDTVMVKAVGDSVVLKGEVSSPEQKEAVIALASAYGYPIIDGIVVTCEGEELLPVTAADVEKAIELDEVTARILNETIILEGVVGNPSDKAKAHNVADTYGKRVINLIEIVSVPEPVDYQWELLVKEVSKQGARLHRVASTPVLEGEVAPKVGAYLESLLDNALDYWVNGLSIVHPAPTPLPSLALIESSLGCPDIDCQYIDDILVLQGSVKSACEKERLERMASLFGVPVQSFLTVTDDVQQVWVDVCIVEVSCSQGQELGIEWDLSLSDGQKVPVDYLGLPVGLSDETVDQRSRSAFSLILGPVWAETHLRSLLRSAEARILASPSLLTENRKQAQFLAGGEIPIPAELNGIEWKPYGVGLTVTPTILENGNIHLQVEPEVSSLDWENGVQLEHALVPGVRTRRWRTQAVVEPGKSLVIGGLLSEEKNTRQRQIPILGELPILGALFRSEIRTKQKTDLVVFVSPRLVQSEDHL
jgi:pilus assembly protein CpaC